MDVARRARETVGRGRVTVIRTVTVLKASTVGLTTVPGDQGGTMRIAALLKKQSIKVSTYFIYNL